MDVLRPEDPQRVSRYQLLARLGSGGMGRVFLGQSPGGRLVAVKVIRPELAENPDFRARFAREVTAARMVSGIFTAPVVDADPDGPQPWLVTAYVDGRSLADAVASQGPLPVASVLTLAAGLAEGLDAIHAAGVVHRDLKPSNVILAPDGPRIIDFGLSRAPDTSALTRTGWVAGSPGFMSPEQAEGHQAGPPSDIFSLGAVLTFAATGDGPFGTGPPTVLLYRVVHGAPALEAIPGRLRHLIERCLDKDSRRRPTAEQILAEPGLLMPAAEWQPAASDRQSSAPAGRILQPAGAPPPHAGVAPPQPAGVAPPHAGASPLPTGGQAEAGISPLPTVGPQAEAGISLPPVIAPPLASPPMPSSSWPDRPLADPPTPSSPWPDPLLAGSLAASSPEAGVIWPTRPDLPADRSQPAARGEDLLAGHWPAVPGPGTARGRPAAEDQAPTSRSSPRQPRGRGITRPRVIAVIAIVAGIAAATTAAVELPGSPAGHKHSGHLSPKAVVEEYFAAINAHRWREVWRLGGSNFNPSLGAMIAGYRHTKHDVVASIHVSGQLVRVRLLAQQTSGAVQTYLLTYRVRGGVITGGHQELHSTSPPPG